MSPTIRVCLADQHRLFHVSIETIVKQSEDMVFSGSVITEEDIMDICRVCQPHLLLLALNALTQPVTDLLAALQTVCPEIKVIILLAYTGEARIGTLLEKGVHGCILKSETPERLVEAIRHVSRGEIWVSTRLLKEVLEMPSLYQTLLSLSDQQKEILLLLVAGKTDRQIAEELHLSERTLRRMLVDLYAHLGATNRVEAAFIAGQHQFIGLYQ